ncbi:MAG: alpha/beta hydrolase [Sporichthyaceae bacterium]
MTSLETVEFETGPQPAWAVILLHGLGDSGDGWAPLAPQLVRQGWPPLRFVFPHAPIAAVTINGGMKMRSWYDIVDLDDLDKRADEAGLLASAAAVEALIEREAERGVPRDRVILAGFSQGGAVAYTHALRSSEPVAGLVALSTYLPMSQTLLKEAPPVDAFPPVFVAHGSFDPVVPVRAGELAADQLRGQGYDVEYHAYPMQHEASVEEMQDLAAWLSQRFAQA